MTPQEEAVTVIQAEEQAVMVCPQCDGEGGYPDGVDEDACHTDCTRCGGNGWIVDRSAFARHRTSSSDAATPDGWQDIASAPKDGTRVLLWISAGLAMPFEWIDGRWMGDDFPLNMATPTHWMPLPAAPTPGEAS